MILQLILIKIGLISPEKSNPLLITLKVDLSVLYLHALVATTGLMLSDQTGISRTIFHLDGQVLCELKFCPNDLVLKLQKALSSQI